MYVKIIRTLLIAFALSLCMVSSIFAQKPVYNTDDATWQNSKLIYPYYEGSLYNISVSVGRVTDIELGAGENFQKAVGGDTTQWLIDKSKIGNITHVYIKPLVNNATTNLVINSDRRAYYFLVATKSSYNPIISFTFPEDEKKLAELKKEAEKKKQEQNLSRFDKNNVGDIIVQSLNYKYKTKSNKGMEKELCPTKIFDDGVKTYIEMPQNRYDLPVLYNVDDFDKEKLSLVNYRIKGKYYVADRVFKHARLQYTKKLYVDIFALKEGEKDEPHRQDKRQI